jgi:hypothetical protein
MMAAGKIINFAGGSRRDRSSGCELAEKCRRLANQCYGLAAVAYDSALATELRRWGDEWMVRADEMDKFDDPEDQKVV